MNKHSKYVDVGVYRDITYVKKGVRRSKGFRRHLMEVIMNCIKTSVTDDRCMGCINRFRIHSVKSLMECQKEIENNE